MTNEKLQEVRPGLTSNEATAPSIGRPPRQYTRGLHDQIVQNIKLGNYPVVAAAMAGITATTFYDWMRRGRENDPHLWEFAQDVELAEGHAEGEFVEVIQKASKDDPEIAFRWLERARSGRWSKQVAQLVNQQLEEFMLKLEAGLSPEIFQMVLAVAVGQQTRAVLPPVRIASNDDSEDQDDT